MNRTLKELPMEERKQILLELEVERAKTVRARHNVSNQVISHLRWYYGKVNHGGFHRDLVGDAKHPIVERVHQMKQESRTSIEVAQILGLDLATVNRVWTSL